jgi:rod shape-determining protein MreD
MNNSPLKYLLLFAFSVIVQVLFLNQIQFSGFVNPYFYILFLMLLPTYTPRYIQLILGFVLGFTIDIFSNTPGIHASATVFIAFVRPFLVRGTDSDDKERIATPTLFNTSLGWFIKYTVIMVLMHHVFLFFIEVFSFNAILNTLLRSLLSSVFTIIVILTSQFIVFRK